MTNIASTIKRSIGRTLGAVVLATALFAPSATSAAHAQAFLSVGIAPPAIPVYDQPPCPGDGYIWTPGYWAYGDQGYFWVDGAWVEAPYEGALWTPGYWGDDNGAYAWNAGYWGNEVGYYGGIDYGFGYFGTGFYGGYWNGGRFFYNRGYNHLDGRRVHNVYDSPYRGGFSTQPGGRSFDPHPPAFANRGSGFNGSRINGGPTQGFRGNGNEGFRGNAGNLNDGGRNNATPTQGFGGNRNTASPDQGFRGNGINANTGYRNTPANQQFEGTAHGTTGYSGFDGDGSRPDATQQQRNFTQPNAQPTGRSFNQQQQPQRMYTAPAPQQQHNAPAAQPQQQHFNAPAAPQQQHSSGGGESHGAGGGRR